MLAVLCSPTFASAYTFTPTGAATLTSPQVCSPCYENPPACTGSETSVQVRRCSVVTEAKIWSSGSGSWHCAHPPPPALRSPLCVQITGVTGDFCSPLCVQNECPKGDGSFSAKPSCVLETQGSSKPTQCALICTPGANGACPTGATCQAIQGEGICTYPTSGAANARHPATLVNATGVINGTATWTDCSGSGFKIDDVKIDPTDIAKGATTVISGSATVGSSVATGTWDLSLTWNGIPLPVTGGSGDICSAGVVTLPLNGGTLEVSPFDCPVSEGTDAIPALTLKLSTAAPGGPYTATFSTTMDGKAGIWCVTGGVAVECARSSLVSEIIAIDFSSHPSLSRTRFSPASLARSPPPLARSAEIAFKL